MYTGSGGKDLSCKVHSSAQVFKAENLALLKSCSQGLPLRVLRGYKSQAFAPKITREFPRAIRYDGIYKVVAAWRARGRFPSSKGAPQNPLPCSMHRSIAL